VGCLSFWTKQAREKEAFLCLGDIDANYKLLSCRADQSIQEQNKFPDIFPGPDCPFRVGVEVTDAITSNEGQFRSFWDAHYGKGETVQTMMADKAKHYPSLSASVIETNSAKIGVPNNGGTSDSVFLIGLITTAITKKLEILNSTDGHAEVYPSNQLLVYSPFPFEEEDYKKAVGDVKYKIGWRKFDVIFIYSDHSLFRYEGNPMTLVNKYDFSPEQIHKWNLQSL
jgi:hypothetical protein